MSVVEAAVLSVPAHLEHVAIEVAQMAARFVADHHGGATALRTKSTPTDVVTSTDLASEQLIRDELVARCPGSSILGEELDQTPGTNGIRWVVDPIDGTVNFLYGLPVVSVSIAAEVDGEVVAGAVADMRSGEVYSACRGEGARHDGTPVRVGEPESLATALVGTGFAYDAATRAEQALLLTRLLPACRDIRCMGSAALNLCWVGAGLIDAYYERDIKLYDYAAGALIAREAGAAVSLPVSESADGLTMAAAPSIAPDLSELLDLD